MAESEELQRVFSTVNGGSSSGDSFEVRLSGASCSWPQATDSIQTSARLHASAPGMVDGVAAEPQHGAAGAAPETTAATGQMFAAAAAATSESITALAAALPRKTEEKAGVQAKAQDCGIGVCAFGDPYNEVSPGQVDRGRGWDAEELCEHQPVTLAAAAAENAGGDERARLSTPTGCLVTLRNVISAAGSVLPQDGVTPLGDPTANVSERHSPSTEASTSSVDITYSVCEQHMRSSAREIAVAEDFAVEAAEEFTEERSTSVAETQVIGAESASEGSTGSSASDCCGCVGPTAETSIPDAAGVPPYLRIETLPALLEGSGGRACVWLGQKKEALLYSVATPFGLNKCVLVCIYMLYAFLTGCVYFGWPSMSYMLLTSGAYSWRCPKDSNGEFINDLRKPQSSSDSSCGDDSNGVSGAKAGKYYICDEQDAAVGPLFTVAYVTQSLMSVVAGTLLDHVSPKHAAMLGQLLNAVGWVLLACSSYTFQAYIPAMVFIGLGADTAYLPTLLIAALFPGKRATVITLLGSANTASFAVPLLLEMLWKIRPDWNFSRICWLYLGVGPFFCCFLAALFIPRSSFGSAALQKLPLQQHQSPLHGSKEDALLRSEERDMKKRSVLHKGRHSGRCCCCSGVNKQNLQDKTKRNQAFQKRTRMSSCGGLYACCSCSDVEREVENSGLRAAGRRQRLCGLVTVVLCSCSVVVSPFCNLLRRIRRVTACCKSQTRVHVAQQQQEPRHPDSSREPSPSLNNKGFWKGDGMKGTEGRGEAHGGVAEGELSTAATSAGELGAGSVAGVSAAVGNVVTGVIVGAKKDKSTLRNVNNAGDVCYYTYDDMREKSNDSAIHIAADDAIEPHEKRHCRSQLCATDACSSKPRVEEKERFCPCVRCDGNSDRAACAALQKDEPFVNSFLPETGLADEDAMKATKSPQHCTRFELTRSAAQADEVCGGEEDAQAFTPAYPIASAGPPGLLSSPVVAEMEEEEEEPSFCSQLLSSHFMCIVMYWSGMAVAISYFQSTSSRLFSTKALDFMDVALSFSFVPCVLLGKMIDLFGPFPALFLVNTMGVLAYCFALGGGSEQNVLQYVSILAFCVYVSVDSEQVFCYVENTFNSKHFGKLSGLALTTGGVISLVSIPLYDEITIRILKKNPLPVCCGLMVVLVLLYFTLGSTWLVRLKHPPAFKAKKKQMGTAAGVTPAAGMDTVLAAAGHVALHAEKMTEEETYAITDAETHTVTGLCSCLDRPHCQCCCCCSGCASGNSSSNTRRMSVRSNNNSDVWTQDRIITNVEDTSTLQRRVASIDCVLRPLADLFGLRRTRARAVDELHHQRGAEWQQQQRRGNRLGKGDDHLQADVV